MIRCGLRGTEGSSPGWPHAGRTILRCASPKHRTSQLTLRGAGKPNSTCRLTGGFTHHPSGSSWGMANVDRGCVQPREKPAHLSWSGQESHSGSLQPPAAAGRWDEELCRAESKKAALKSRTSGKTFRSAEFNTVQNIWRIKFPLEKFIS